MPQPLAAGRSDWAWGCLGVALGLFGTQWLSHHWLGDVPIWFLAPMGASAVLVFLLPASPLAQPWALLGGNVVSALVGVGLQRWLGPGPVVAAGAAALAVAAMWAMRCVHPPGGAMALTAVLGGSSVQRLDWGWVSGPVLVNSVCLAVFAWAFNRVLGRAYPHHGPAHPHRTNDPPPTHRAGVSSADLDAALASYQTVLDIDRDDLEEILVRAQLHAQRRHWAGVRCEHIMSRDVVRIGPHDPLEEAWRRLATHKVKALPVTDAEGRLVGILSLHDFFVAQPASWSPRPPMLANAYTVRELMSPRVVTARPEQALADLVPAFSDGGLHHMPVVDADGRVVGMVTQSDMVAALFKSAPASTEVGGA